MNSKAIPEIIHLASIFAVLFLFLIGFPLEHYDTTVFYETGKIAHEHGFFSVYQFEVQNHSSFPLGIFDYPLPWLFFVYASYLLSGFFSFDRMYFLLFLKLSLMPFVFGCAFLIKKILELQKIRELTREFASFSLLVFPGIPIAGVSFWVGNFDVIPVFFCLLSLFHLSKKFLLPSYFYLGVAGAFKLYPLFLLPFLLLYCKKEEKKYLFFLTAVAFFPLLVVSIPPIIYDAGSYFAALFSISSAFGRTTVFNLLSVVAPHFVRLISIVSIALTLMLFAVASYIKPRINLLFLVPLLSLVSLWYYAQPSYWSWVLPFALIHLFTDNRIYARFAAIVFLFSGSVLFLSYNAYSPLIDLVVAPLSACLYLAYLLYDHLTSIFSKSQHG